MRQLKRAITALAARRGYRITRIPDDPWELYPEASQRHRDVIAAVLPYTMTPPTRVWNLLNAVDYVIDQDIPGAMVECGVWRGGSVMAMALELLERGAADRELWLYDTFAGMTEPTSADVIAATGRTAVERLRETPFSEGLNIWAYASRADVAANLERTGYPAHLLRFVQGDVAMSLRQIVP
ncbi:MAG: TylF/MycF family methyltransferase, partial [Actinomycetia bacterium]|nr:TylF/MycF family methyltransferase [Actinomycetes bacterium]